MLLKSADDKSKRLALLGELQNSPRLNQAQRKWLRDELWRTRRGIQGERDAAHYLDTYFKNSETHVVLHDLRLIVDGDVAQIDHLLINRGTGIFLIETKNYSGDLVINDRGEFTALYGEDKYGIESPLEQSLRHERVLMKLLERLDITSRTGEHPKIHHVVMLHPKAVITRPDPKAFDTRNVIKADQFPSWHKQFVDGLGVTGMLSAALNMRSLDTIREWGEKLRRQHRPDDPLRLPDFMAPSEVKPAEARQVAQPKSTPVNPITVQQDAPAPREKRLICSTCGGKISFAEGRFCWNNPTRFGGLQYCREHQQQF